MRWVIAGVLLLTVNLAAHHDEPGSYREYELKQERIDIELYITELLHQLTYVPVAVHPQLYQEMQDLQQRWNQVIQELIEIDRTEHPTPPGYSPQ